jgi:hypothetical protein
LSKSTDFSGKSHFNLLGRFWVWCVINNERDKQTEAVASVSKIFHSLSLQLSNAEKHDMPPVEPYPELL